MYRDPRGVPVSASRPGTVDELEALLVDVLAFGGDPVGLARRIRAADPACVLAGLTEAALFAWSLHPPLQRTARRLLGELRAQLERAGERERLLAAAIDAWLGGRYGLSRRRFDALLASFPGDLLALFFAHQADFFAGAVEALRARPAALVAHLGAGAPASSFALGMRAFGEEEAGRFGLAEELGREAVAARPTDRWAIHAVAHVYEETGRTEEGIAWYRQREGDWAEASYFACHNAWHLALYHLAREEFDEALAVYDRHLRPGPRSILLNLCDAVALLWRLHLAGAGPGERAVELRRLFDAAHEPGLHPFTDVHALVLAALVGDTGHLAGLRRAVAGRAGGEDERARMLRALVLPLADALADILAGRWKPAAEALTGLAPRFPQMTGSRAQRELLGLTLIEAAARAGLTDLARRELGERLRTRREAPLLAERLAALG